MRCTVGGTDLESLLLLSVFARVRLSLGVRPVVRPIPPQFLRRLRDSAKPSSFGEPINSDESGLVNGSSAPIEFSLGLINRGQMTMHKFRDAVQAKPHEDSGIQSRFSLTLPVRYVMRDRNTGSMPQCGCVDLKNCTAPRQQSPLEGGAQSI